MPLINCEINVILTWADKCVLSNNTKPTATKLSVPVVVTINLR